MKKLKLPKFTLFAGRSKKLQATTAARRAPASDNYYEEEPKTNLSSAFVVVLVLHVVAVGGIYAFNSIRASRQPAAARASESATSSVGTPLVPKSKEAPAAETGPAKGAAAPVSKGLVYHVQAGDNLTKIALMHNVTVADLEEVNGLKADAVLRANQTLNIPNGKSAAKAIAPVVAQDSRKAAFLSTKAESTPAVAAAANSAARTYVVAKGDTPTSVAKKFGTTPEELLKLNKIEDPKKMRAGLTLKVPAKKI